MLKERADGRCWWKELMEELAERLVERTEEEIDETVDGEALQGAILMAQGPSCPLEHLDQPVVS